MRDWRARAEHLADELAAKGALRTRPWREAVVNVPRHELVQDYYEYDGGAWHRADSFSPEGEARWLDLVYSNSALFVLPDGLSSSSMPSLMVRMLELLDVRDGHKVLEIGTGSGYNAALLAHLSTAEHSRTRLAMPRPWEHPIPWFFAHLTTGFDAAGFGQRADPITHQPGDGYVVTPDGSWCEIAAQPDRDGQRTVWQGGPRRIWDDFETACAELERLGQPGWERFGLTVTRNEQVVWLDEPNSARWPLPTLMGSSQ